MLQTSAAINRWFLPGAVTQSGVVGAGLLFSYLKNFRSVTETIMPKLNYCDYQ
jgi:hypothetical protein